MHDKSHLYEVKEILFLVLLIPIQLLLKQLFASVFIYVADVTLATLNQGFSRFISKNKKAELLHLKSKT